MVAHDEQTRKLVGSTPTTTTQCQREGVVDFAELMLRSTRLLRDNATIASTYQHRFRHILGGRVPGHQQAAVRVAEDVCPPDNRQGKA